MPGYDLLLLLELPDQPVPAYGMAGGHALLTSTSMLLFRLVQEVHLFKIQFLLFLFTGQMGLLYRVLVFFTGAAL